VADRIYVGDADGTLWRVNLTSLSPQNWTVELAWDAYSLAGDTPEMGEPIQTPPVVSIDPAGNTVILFSTGDQEMFTSSAVQTRVWSITEKAVGSDFIRSENWLIPFTQGKRVTGPISLFDAVAYFATYTPPTDQNAACAYGFGSVWGVHYNRKWQDDTTLDPPLPAGALNPFPQARFICSGGDSGCTMDPAKPGTGVTFAKDQPAGTTVFGVAIAQTPTCFNETVSQDPFYGPVWSFDQTSRGEFRLVYQTGKGGSASEGSVTKTVDELLPSPKQFVRIDSWASVVE
jgi:type IV pilus assembly protein PilY1